MKKTRTKAFAMTKKTWDAIDYLNKNRINLSAIVQKALNKEAERQKLIKKQFPE